jgi:hypothetical protein
LALGPQLPPRQCSPETHSASLAQVVRHWFLVLSHRNGAQMMSGPARHAPAPSQINLPATEAPLQLPGEQTVPIG